MCEVSGVESNCTFWSITLRQNEVLSYVSPNPWIRKVEFLNSNLYSLPGEVFELFENLRNLTVFKQNIKNIRKNTFAKARSLKFLSLSHNGIKIVKTDDFKGCGNLEELYINYNQLDSIEDGAFDNLPFLRVLGLNENNIVTINENIFKFNMKLQCIGFTKNQLNSLSKNTFVKLKHLNFLSLGNNTCINSYWESNAFQSMTKIKESLKWCNLNYFVDATRKKLDDYSENMEDLNAAVFKIEQRLERLEEKTGDNRVANRYQRSGN